jgi:ribose-phosphate pyrophosphokinase
MLIYSLTPESPLAAAVAADLDETLAPHEERRFGDGECKLRPLTDPRGDDAYVICSLHGDADLSPHDKLWRLLMFVATLHDHGAARVSAVVPYLAYARKDRRTQPWDPVATRYVAQLFEAVGTAQVIALEAHNVAAFENAFRCSTQHLPAHDAFTAAAAGWAGDGPLAVASPDPGGVKRAQLWREALSERLARPVGFAMVDKRRSAGLVTSLDLVAGDVDGMMVLLYDDLIASGETMVRAARALHHAGASRIVAVAAHGLFMPPADEVLADPHIAAIAVTDSVPPFRLPAASPVRAMLQVLPAAPLLAQAIRRSHDTWVR